MSSLSGYSEKSKWSLLNIAFALFLFFAFTYPMPTRSQFGFISPLIVGMLFIFLCLNFFMSEVTLYWNRFTKDIFVVFLFLLLSEILCLLFFQPLQQLPYLLARVALLIIFLSGLSFSPSLSNLDRLMRIYCFSIIILSLLTVLQGLSLIELGSRIRPARTFFEVEMPFMKASGIDMSYGEFGIMTVPAFLFFFLQLFSKSGIRPQKGRFLAILIIAWALFISQSRSIWLGLILSVSTIIFMLSKNKKRKLLIIGIIIAVVSVLILTHSHTSLLEGFIGEGRYELNVLNRLASFSLAWESFIANPLVGIGHGNLTYVVRGRDMVIHNQILDQLSSTGILGTIPLVLLYIIFLKSAIRIYRQTKDDQVRGFSIWVFSTMVYTLTGLMFYRGLYSEHLPWFFAVLGMLFSIQYGYKKVKL
jgi:O-antigen ligase